MSVLQRVGNTPLIELEGVYVKLECANPGGSVKDRVARYMLEEARRRGELHAGDVIVEATSGNTGIALAWIARVLGYSVIVFMPEHMSIERRLMLEELGAEVRLSPREEGMAGAVARRDALRGRPGHYVPDQYGNPDGARCHRLTTGVELIAQVRQQGVTRLDWFVAGVGTGGTLMGVGEALRESMPGARLAAVEPEESAVLSGSPAGEHGITGIGDGFVPALVDRARIDEVVRVGTAEAHTAASRLRIQHGYCVGMSAGANMVAALRLKARGGKVATVWPDCSDRYVSMGLGSAGSGDVRCPLKASCEARGRTMLGRDVLISPSPEAGA